MAAVAFPLPSCNGARLRARVVRGSSGGSGGGAAESVRLSPRGFFVGCGEVGSSSSKASLSSSSSPSLHSALRFPRPLVGFALPLPFALVLGLGLGSADPGRGSRNVSDVLRRTPCPIEMTGLSARRS